MALTNQALQIAADAMNEIMVTGLKIRCDSIVDGAAQIEILFTDKDGNDVMVVASASLRPGDSASAGGLERALHVTLS